MNPEKLNLVYFSATGTTQKVVRGVAEQMSGEKTEYDITQTVPPAEIRISSDELLIVGMPVYAGRIPALSLPALSRFKGSDTPAIVVCVYGNREYDDALLELKDVVEGNGFRVVAAGAFIAQHSIFPVVGANRPDERDMKLLADFALESQRKLASIKDINAVSEIVPKGNRPYKVPGKLPLQPKGSRQCTKCGACVKLCPAQAIAADTPRKTNKERCIACGRCIVVCPVHARHFGGLLYKIAGKKFVKAYSGRKEPEMFL